MTNALLEVLVTRAGEKPMGIRFKQRSSQLETTDGPWKAGHLLQRKAESHGPAASCACRDHHSSTTLGRHRSARGSPDRREGERNGSPSIPAARSSSHNYLGWDHQFGKQEKELGVR